MEVKLMQVAREMVTELPSICIADMWKLALDNWWHMCDDRCGVCKSTPCDYAE